MNKRVSLLAVMFAVSLMGVQAQDSQSKSSTKSDVLLRQARSDDRSQRIELLRAFEDGSIAVDGDSLRALEILAGTGTLWRDVSAHPTDFSDVRAAALVVLGKSSMPEARDVVLRVVDLETHPMVMTAGFAAIAALGSGDSVLTLRVLNEAMLRNMARTRNNSVADEYINAIEALVDPATPDLQTVEILTDLSRGARYSYIIRTRAHELLRKFW